MRTRQPHASVRAARGLRWSILDAHRYALDGPHALLGSPRAQQMTAIAQRHLATVHTPAGDRTSPGVVEAPEMVAGSGTLEDHQVTSTQHFLQRRRRLSDFRKRHQSLIFPGELLRPQAEGLHSTHEDHDIGYLQQIR